MGNAMIHFLNITNELPAMKRELSPTQMTILRHFFTMPATSVYPELRDLNFELKMREQILAAAQGLNGSGASFAVFEHSRCNPQFWQREQSGGFRLRPDRTPAAALRDIFSNGRLYAFECATAIVIVLYKATLEMIGEKAYNRLFANTILFHWNVDQDLGLTTIRTRQFIPGDVLYFDNPEVHPLTPQWQGENVVFMGNGLYYGHGVGIRSAREIIMALNSKRAPFAIQSAYLLDQASRPDYVRLSQVAAASPEPATASVDSSVAGAWPWRTTIGNRLTLYM